MLSRLFSLFFQDSSEAESISQQERAQIATAAVLVEAARADREFSPEEREHIVTVLRQRFQLNQQDAEELLAESKKTLAESSDLWSFTNAINQNCTPAEKQEIVEEAWRVILMDGALHAHEDYLIHKLARLLNLDHPMLIEAKLKVLEECREGGEPTP